jgi:DNA-binding MarR family transcriptional regulator
VGQLAAMTLFEPTRLTRILDQMEATGLILRADDAADRRRRRLTLTDSGRSIATELVAHARAHEAAVIGAVGAEDIAAMKRPLN